jgi:hypothetical protein
MGACATHENAGTNLESIDSGEFEKATQHTQSALWVFGLLSLSVVAASPTAASPASAAVTAPTHAQVQSAVNQLAAASAPAVTAVIQGHMA